MGLQGPRPLTQEPTQMMVTRLPFSGAYEVRQGLRAMMRWDLFRTEYEFSIAETTHYRLIDWIQHTFTFFPSCRVEVWRSLIGLQSRGQQGHILLQKLQGRICPCLLQLLEMKTHPSILARRIPWTGESDGLWSLGSQRDGHDWITEHVHIDCLHSLLQSPFFI